MADILYLGKKSTEFRPKTDNSIEQVLGGADIIFFPGVRYERACVSPVEGGDRWDDSINPVRPNSP